jgi:hypothetical protein
LFLNPIYGILLVKRKTYRNKNMPEINAWSPETGFQHKPPGHNKKHLHWAIFIAVVLAAAALAVIYVEKFKTEEDIDSLQVLPEVGKKQTNSNFDQSRLDFHEFEDGTVYVKGIVESHKTGCDLDLSCILFVKVNSEKSFGLVYHEGDVECGNPQPRSFVKWGKNIKPGDVVKAFGVHKNGYITFCSSPDFFILNEDDPLPDGGLKQKLMVRDWKTYQNENNGLEFKYPPDMVALNEESGWFGQVVGLKKTGLEFSVIMGHPDWQKLSGLPTSSTTLLLGGREWKKYESNQDSEKYTYYLAQEGLNGFYVILVKSELGNYNLEDEAIIREVLSSVKVYKNF